MCVHSCHIHVTLYVRNHSYMYMHVHRNDKTMHGLNLSNTCMLYVHICTAVFPYLYIPEPWFQLIDSISAIFESKQSKIEGPSRVETLVGRVIDVLTKKKKSSNLTYIICIQIYLIFSSFPIISVQDGMAYMYM